MNKTSTQSGFTLVEIIIVIVLIGIVSYIGITRTIGGNAFNALIVRDEVISLARTAQQNSLGRSGVTLTITPDAGGNSVTIATSDTSGTLETSSLSIGAVSLSGDINITDSCAVTPGADDIDISSGNSMTLDFEELGDLGDSGVSGSLGAISSALRICINNDAASSVCVSPSGFAYAGDCDV